MLMVVSPIAGSVRQPWVYMLYIKTMYCVLTMCEVKAEMERVMEETSFFFFFVVDN